MHFTVFIREEGTGFWAEVSELPGCFASARTLTELPAALGEAIGLYLGDEPVAIKPVQLSVGETEISAEQPTEE